MPLLQGAVTNAVVIAHQAAAQGPWPGSATGYLPGIAALIAIDISVFSILAEHFQTAPFPPRKVLPVQVGAMVGCGNGGLAMAWVVLTAWSISQA